MSDTESQKLAVEIVVDEHGLEEAESRIKAQTDQHGRMSAETVLQQLRGD